MKVVFGEIMEKQVYITETVGGIKEKLLDWMKDLLDKRTMRVMIRDK